MSEADHANASRCLLITLAIWSCVSSSKVFPSLNVLPLIFFSSHSSTGWGLFSPSRWRSALSQYLTPGRSPGSFSLPPPERRSRTSPRHPPLPHRPRRPPPTSYPQLADFPAQLHTKGRRCGYMAYRSLVLEAIFITLLRLLLVRTDGDNHPFH